ncbi:uncharacterized protein DEA37_0006434 [Paragonimus westermani]|uniref:Peptidase C1A papain C-terminal domain-containing protein n=1 Tax=Paragonimus westermani TaxID=34504 RepID=A0A5J4N8U0_9TREM|nr:uncharacterized protein DEA37_0006434 [Paragonimus westermani]
MSEGARQDRRSTTLAAVKVTPRRSYNVRNRENDIMRELMKNGPMEVVFDVYEDFMNYDEGIYHHVTDKVLFVKFFKRASFSKFGVPNKRGSEQQLNELILVNGTFGLIAAKWSFSQLCSCNFSFA